MYYPLMSNNIEKEDVDNLINFLQNTDRFTNGPKVREFEKAWADWLGVKYCVFVNSGSSANFITMGVLRELYGQGEVIVPAITWSSDIASVFAAGMEPVFVDVNFHNMAMAEDEVLSHITPRTKAIFLTHILGFNGLSTRLVQELERRDIMLIEDVCESHGTMFGDKKAGTIGSVSNFSFYYAHHMSTIEGGMVCTNDKTFYEYARMFRSHGMSRECDDDKVRTDIEKTYSDVHPEFIFTVPGYNMRSTEINAVIGLSQLKKLDARVQRRKDNFKFFLDHVNGEKYFTDFDTEGNSNYAFVVLLKKEYSEHLKELCKALDDAGIEFRRGTSGGGNMTRQPFVRKRIPNIKPESYVNADYIHQYGMYIGNYPKLEQEKILRLCEVLDSI